MSIKLVKGFLIFTVAMLIAQIIALVLSFAMAMDGANNYSDQSNLLYRFLKNILGFPLYLIVDFDSLTNSKEFRYELIPLFIGNTLLQFSMINIVKHKLKK